MDDVEGQARLTGAQRLFMNWAYCWRTKRRKEQELQLLTIDPHSPAEFRANIVRNLDEFHTAFDTREGDGLWLDPEQRVRIWCCSAHRADGLGHEAGEDLGATARDVGEAGGQHLPEHAAEVLASRRGRRR